MLITQISLDNKLVMVQQVLMVQTWVKMLVYLQQVLCSNVFGQFAGQFATNAYANFMGNQAGYQATSANNSNFFGIGAVVRHQVL
jgi:hypothetical protein